MDARDDLSAFLEALGDELVRWGRFGESFEAVLTPLMGRHVLSDEQVRALQGLDSLIQHLHELGRLCADMGGAGADRQAVAAALAGLSLGSLQRRLGRGEAADEAAAGECELW